MSSGTTSSHRTAKYGMKNTINAQNAVETLAGDVDIDGAHTEMRKGTKPFSIK